MIPDCIPTILTILNIAIIVISPVCCSVDTSLRQDAHGTARVNHRVSMLFPLLLGISGRLAALLPTALTAVFGVFLFVAFSKKAFIISLIALFLTYLDKYKKRGHNVIHLHQFGHHGADEGEEEVYQSYHPHRKHKVWKKPLSHSSHSSQEYTFYPSKFSKYHGPYSGHYPDTHFSSTSYQSKRTYRPEEVLTQRGSSKSDSYARNPYGPYPPDSSYLSTNPYSPYPSQAAFVGGKPSGYATITSYALNRGYGIDQSYANGATYPQRGAHVGGDGGAHRPDTAYALKTPEQSQVYEVTTERSTEVPADFQEFLKLNLEENKKVK